MASPDHVDVKRPERAPSARRVAAARRAHQRVGGSPFFWTAKRAADIAAALFLLPFLGLAALLILIFNPIMNPGTLFFVQPRMGRDCKPFAAFKFRTMRARPKGERGRLHDAPLEVDRITPLGRFLRRSRIDELPQAINILKGEMSLIGPRPDFFGHARIYLRTIPEYRDRHNVRPGLSGLAQVTQGYAEGVEATREKARLDRVYIRRAGFKMDAKLLFLTVWVVIGGKGR